MVASDFFNRLSAYPMVASAYNQAAAGVAWAKDHSAYAKSAVDLAESGLRRAVKTASPLLTRYEDRAAGLDRLACRQLLDRLEAVCPTVLEPTDKVVERGRDYYSATVKPKVDLLLSPVAAAAATAGSVKSSAQERYRHAVASRLGQSGLRRFDRLIEVLGDCADRCLPPGPDEKPKKTEEQRAEATTEAPKEDQESRANGHSKPVELADPVHSLVMAYELGRRVGTRATERLAEAGHQLVWRLTGRSASPATSDKDTDSASSSSSDAAAAPPPQRSASSNGVDEVDERDDEEADENVLDRTDMSTD